MRISRAVILSALGGVALGAFPLKALRAQTKPPVIVLIDVSQISDPQAYSMITRIPTASIAATKYGGRYLSRNSQVTALDGTVVPKALTDIGFDSADQAQTWYNSPEQKPINDARLKSTKSTVIMVQGPLPQ